MLKPCLHEQQKMDEVSRRRAKENTGGIGRPVSSRRTMAERTSRRFAGGLTMRTFVAILLASLLSFAIGRHSGRADAECEAYTSGYEAGLNDAYSNLESK